MKYLTRTLFVLALVFFALGVLYLWLREV